MVSTNSFLVVMSIAIGLSAGLIPVVSYNEGAKRYFNNKTDCMVIKAFDGSLYANILDTLYLMEEVPEHERFSKEFDDEPDTKEKKVKRKYIPPMTHPWKLESFKKQLQKSHYQQQYA